MAGTLAPDPADLAPKRAFTSIALYKGNIVAVKFIQKRSFDLTRSIRKELTQVGLSRILFYFYFRPFCG